MKHTQIKQMILGALFVAIGLVLPFFTGQIPAVGRMLLPMHIPVLLCGLICGWKYGLAVGAVLPLTRSLLFGMPTLYPTAIAMTFELATYPVISVLCPLYDSHYFPVKTPCRLTWPAAGIPAEKRHRFPQTPRRPPFLAARGRAGEEI